MPSFTHKPTVVSAEQFDQKKHTKIEKLLVDTEAKLCTQESMGSMYYIFFEKWANAFGRINHGDWVVVYPSGSIAIMTDAQFLRNYKVGEES